MKPIYLYSGECLAAKCGVETELRDVRGDVLHTGDVVLLWLSQGEDLAPIYYGLTAIVEDKHTTYSDGTIKIDRDGKPFVMGIKECGLDSEWYVETVKKWSDVISGEHWSRFGFRYDTKAIDVRLADRNASEDRTESEAEAPND